MIWRVKGKEKKYTFIGAYDQVVKLTIFPQEIEHAAHVVVFAIYKGQLLFTKHKIRGLEWPGGKVEEEETPEEAARREVREETGGECSALSLIGQYKVYRNEKEYFVKNIYFTEISSLDNSKISGIDTEGAILLPLDVSPSLSSGYSPLVLDGVFEYVRKAVLDLG